MKFLIIIFISTLAFLPLSAQSNYKSDLPYTFPVTRLQVIQYPANDRSQYCQVPDSVLHSMTTQALILTCLDYPLLPDFLVYDAPITGFARVTSTSNAFQELSKRSDASTVLLAEFVNHRVQPLNTFSDKSERDRQFMFAVVLAAMMSDERILMKLSAEDSKALVKASLDKSVAIMKDPSENYYRSYLFIPLTKILYPRYSRSSNALLKQSSRSALIIQYIDSGRNPGAETLNEIEGRGRDYLAN